MIIRMYALHKFYSLTLILSGNATKTATHSYFLVKCKSLNSLSVPFLLLMSLKCRYSVLTSE